ncbi:hypothetical protein KAS14_07090 [Candidatus Bathyarchaeota archaeon]|nr:hypothetical protein [Candidatus Bathyarchaeota archaeon]
MQKAKKPEERKKHRLRVMGSSQFKDKVKEALKLIKTAKYYDFLRTNIKRIVEVGGLSQLREEEAFIWANKYTVADPIEAAGYFIQKTEQMKTYLEGKPYFGGIAEAKTTEKRIEFLQELKNKSRRKNVRERCEEALKRWDESKFL